MNKFKVLLVVLLFVVISCTPVLAQFDGGAKKGVEKQLKLMIFKDDSNNAKRHRIKAVIKNISKKPAIFYLETCGICFWSFSVNGNKYKSLSNAVHCRMCDFSHKVTLKPGHQVVRYLRAEDLYQYIKEMPSAKVRLKYILNYKKGGTLKSNNLVLK